MSAMKQASIGPYRVPPEPRRWSAIALAVAVHAFLLSFLWVGISWQNNKPAAVEAEVWDMKVQTAAPPPPPPAEAPEPEPEPEPAPAPKVVEQPAPPAPAPDIRLEQEKKRKEELRKKELAEEKKREEIKAKEEAKKEADKKAKEEAAKKEAEKKAEELAKKKEAEQKEKAEKAAKAKADAQKKAALEKQRQQDLQRMMAQAGAGTSGTAAKSTAPKMDSGYVAAITAKIKSLTSYAGNTDVAGNPTVVFKVEQLPTGEIISVRKVKSSGMPEFDDAVERGISKSSPLPKKKDGTVERSLEVSFHMKDLH